MHFVLYFSVQPVLVLGDGVVHDTMTHFLTIFFLTDGAPEPNFVWIEFHMCFTIFFVAYFFF